MKIDSIPTSNNDELTITPPTTEEVWNRLRKRVYSALESKTNTLIDSSTSTGKTYLIATTPWLEYPELTGGKPVIHVHQTKTARDEAIARSRDAHVRSYVIRSREERCPVTRGDHDDELTAPDGKTPSEWFKQRCDVEGTTFAKVHKELEVALGGLDCSPHDQRCPAFRQWSHLPESDDAPMEFDVIHTVAEIAQAYSLIEGANLIFDEQPTYIQSLGPRAQSHLQEATNDLVHRKTGGEFTLHEVITAVRDTDYGKLSEIQGAIGKRKPGGWMRSHDTKHEKALKCAQAILAGSPAAGGRIAGEWRRFRIVIDEKGKFERVHDPAPFEYARCVIGLDAYPVPHLWRMNTVDDLLRISVLTDEERRAWRREERGLTIIRIGDAVYSCTRGWPSPYAKRKVKALIQTLRDKHGENFSTCITASAVKSDVERFMREAGIENPTVLHYGDIKSRNDFDGESVGLLIGCIDPGDHKILSEMALCGFDAEQEIDENQDGSVSRQPGRGFVGLDADKAAESLAEVREHNIAQAVGRYARSPGSGDSQAIVYVVSAALPDYLTDQVLSIEYSEITETQEAIEDYLRSSSPVTAQEVEEEIGITRKYAWEVLKKMVEKGIATKQQSPDDGRVTEYCYRSGSLQSTVQLKEK